MATISIATTLDVLEKYESLVQESLDGGSVYIRAKETIQEFFEDNTITSAERSQIVSNIVGTAVNTITTASMNAAVQWAQAEKEFALRKLEAEIQLDILTEEKKLKAAQAEQIASANRLAKVESRRMYGVPTFDSNDNIISLTDTGKVWADIQLTDAQKDKVVTEDALTAQKITESYAAVHKIVADTYVNYGNYTYMTPTVTGITAISPEHGAYKTLSVTQQEIAIEQAKGYVYNAWSNALTGSASMLGTAIAAEYAKFDKGEPGEVLLNTILATATNLKNATTTADEAIPA